MPNAKPDNSLGFGVYYAAEDYIGFGRRLGILLLDTTVLAAAMFLFSTVWLTLVDDAWGIFFALTVIVAWLYLVPLKRSSLRTAGYRAMKCRVVTLRGETPSLFMLTFRLLFWVMGPGNLLNDLIWCGIDQDRQTLRDRFSGICVINNEAAPKGEGPIHFAYYDAMGYNLMLPWVVHSPETKTVPPS